MMNALVCDVNNINCMIHRGESCPCSASLKRLLRQKLSEFNDDQTLLVEQ